MTQIPTLHLALASLQQSKYSTLHCIIVQCTTLAERRKIQIQSDNHGHNGGNGAEEIKIKVTTKGKDGVQQMLWCWSQPFWEVPV